MAHQFVSYNDLPKEIRKPLLELEDFIGSMDGCDVVNGCIDDGIVDASDAVMAFNEIVARLRQLPPTTTDSGGK